MVLGMGIFDFFQKQKNKHLSIETKPALNQEKTEGHKEITEKEHTPTPEETGRNAVYNENSRLFSGYRLLATLDTHTCLVCGVLDGKECDTPEITHKCLNEECRCMILPIVKGLEGFDDDDQRAAADGPVPAKWTYETWFKKQKRIIKRRILGPKYFDLHTTKKMSLTKIAELMKNDKDFINDDKSWLNYINDNELLECLQRRITLDDKLLNKIDASSEIKDILYYYPTSSTGRYMRKIIRDEEALNHPVSELYEILYSVGVLSSLILPESQRLKIETGYVFEIMPGGSLLKLPMPYKDIGYEKISFFTKGDWKIFNKLWGKPENHMTLNDYYSEIYEFYENKFFNDFMKSEGVL